MRTAARGGGGTEGNRTRTRLDSYTTRAAAGQEPIPDLPVFRDRLVAARARLIERIILEYDPERAYPDTAWTRMVADLHVVIMAVDAMIEEST
ncbi:MAG: hypothetical protein O7F75_02430 [Alphaproteobacteria bacterium]|nr:hypothetical protein [Alphaproteobacteria bacterium]